MRGLGRCVDMLLRISARQEGPGSPCKRAGGLPYHSGCARESSSCVSGTSSRAPGTNSTALGLILKEELLRARSCLCPCSRIRASGLSAAAPPCCTAGSPPPEGDEEVPSF